MHRRSHWRPLAELLPSLRTGSAVRRWSTRRQRAWQADTATLRGFYRPGGEILLTELLDHGLVALGDEANLARLERCAESDILKIAASLLEHGWSDHDIAQIAHTWKSVRGQAS